MVFLRIFLIYVFAIFFVSCAKVQYLLEQGQGQVGLLNKARPNEEVLKDVKVSPKVKDKIQQIEIYKKYYYEYFAESPTKIYSKTTLLDRDAVTYLVIASPHDRIEAKEECFPFMGCFPYLGFFELSSAQSYSKKLRNEGLITWIRPVSAYSTLGHFSDPILSSFFVYSEYELAEMIFHELFHTVFWVKDEVELNENLAVYFSEALAAEYFHLDESSKKEKLAKKKNDDYLMKSLLLKIEELNILYKKTPSCDPQRSQIIFHQFMKENFTPSMEKVCQELKFSKDLCWPLKREWNNAAFAAILTYESRGAAIAELHQKQKGDLKDFYRFLQKQYDIFKKRNEDSFAKYLTTL